MTDPRLPSPPPGNKAGDKSGGKSANRLSPAEKRRRMFRLLLAVAIALTLYLVIAYYELYAVIGALYVIAGLLFIVYFYLSHAMASELPAKEDLSPAWDDARKEAYLRRWEKNRVIARRMVYVILPLFLVLALDILLRYAIGITPHELWSMFSS